MTATKQRAREIAQAIEPYVNTLLMATAVAQLERKRVDAIQRGVLSEQNYYGRDHEENQMRITDPKITYLLDDHSASAYFAKLNAIHLAEGFEEATEGKCPALCAEHLKTQAEWALILAAEPFFPGVTNDKLLCGTTDLGGLETRQKYINLLIGLVVNRPEYKSPLKSIA